MAILNDDLKVTIFTVPKCGSTSAKVFAHELASRAPHPGITPDGSVVGIHKQFPCEAFEAVMQRAPSDHAKVGFLRDPFSRISSWYYGVVAARPWVLQAQQDALRARNLSTRPLPPMKHLNYAQQANPGLTPRLRERIARIYAEDLELLGSSFHRRKKRAGCKSHDQI